MNVMSTCARSRLSRLDLLQLQWWLNYLFSLLHRLMNHRRPDSDFCQHQCLITRQKRRKVDRCVSSSLERNYLVDSHRPHLLRWIRMEWAVMLKELEWPDLLMGTTVSVQASLTDLRPWIGNETSLFQLLGCASLGLLLFGWHLKRANQYSILLHGPLLKTWLSLIINATHDENKLAMRSLRMTIRIIRYKVWNDKPWLSRQFRFSLPF